MNSWILSACFFMLFFPLAIEHFSRDCPPGGEKQNAAQSNSTSQCFGHGERRKNGRQLSTDVDGNSDRSTNTEKRRSPTGRQARLDISQHEVESVKVFSGNKPVTGGRGAGRGRLRGELMVKQGSIPVEL
jgi:hypothetical protein